MGSDEVLLACNKLTKIYPSGAGIRGVTLALRAGEVHGFVGPNGAGKTTTIRTLLGILLPDSGEVVFDRRSLVRRGPQLHSGGSGARGEMEDGRSHLGVVDFGATRGVPFDEGARTAFLGRTGYVPSEFQISKHLRLSVHLDLVARTRARFAATAIATSSTSRGDRGLHRLLQSGRSLASRFGVDLDGRFGELSRGTRQKFAIVLAWFFDPDVLVLDEPTAGLDPIAREQLHGLVAQAREQGKAVLYSSHDLHEVEELCDKVSLIRQGSVVATFDVDRLKAPLPWRFKVVGDSSLLSEALGKLDGVRILRGAGSDPGEEAEHGVAFNFQGRLSELFSVLSHYDITDIEVGKPELEEVIVDFYRGIPEGGPGNAVDTGQSPITRSADEHNKHSSSDSGSYETEADSDAMAAMTRRASLTSEERPAGGSLPSWAATLAWVLYWLRVRSRFLAAWILSVAALAALTVALYPAFRENPGLQQYVESIPESVVAFFGILGDPGAYSGWLSMELYSNYMPITLAFFGVFAGTSAMAGVERGGDCDSLLSLPVPKWFLVVASSAEVVFGTLMLSGALTAITWIGNLAFGGDLDAAKLLGGPANVAGLAILAGGVGMAVSARMRGYGKAVGISAALVVGSYVWNGLASLVESLGSTRIWSPFYHYGAGTVVGPRWSVLAAEAASFFVLAAISGYWVKRRDFVP